MMCRHVPATLKSRSRGFIFWGAFCLLSVGAILVFTTLESCRHTPTQPAPVTVTLLDPGWLDKEFLAWRKHEEEDFTRETGIQVKDFPAPETAIDQLALWHKLLQDSSNAPDVFAIDVIWPELTAEFSLNLNSYQSDTANDFQRLVNNDIVKGQLVAMPYHADAGLLFYRTDLIQEYGFKGPPSTWDELERMASRIQKGERAKGREDFWGFVWQGAASEALTCNALEWQASEGGGRIIEPDRFITVNNPATIRSWERAARWVGSISPPSVVAYREWDALNIWRSGNAAFMRNWPTSYLTSEVAGMKGRFAATVLPAGRSGRAATLGGASLSISRSTRHPKEAAALLRYLCRRDVELARAIATSQPPVMPELYRVPDVLTVRPHFAELEPMFRTQIVERPSTVAGKEYDQVSAAYFNAVHSVLTKQKNATAAVADLEQELTRITGFQPKSESGARGANPGGREHGD